MENKYIEHKLNSKGKTYVISDIHGNYSKFLKMIKKINFTSEDTMYILGDVFDRGKQSFNILGYIIKHPNIHLIRGNHEEFLLTYHDEGETWDWLQNGGQKTLTQYINKDYMQQEFIYNYIKNSPKCIIIDDKFILSHAGLYIPPFGNEYSINQLFNFLGSRFLWHRETIGKEKPYKHYIQICGHNRVQNILDMEEEEVKILKRPGIMYIDCGCDLKNGFLACLCLNDMNEYYI